MSEETLLPYCSNCGCSITDFSAFYQVPCHHLYCHKCINSLHACTIDKQAFGMPQADCSLERGVEDWKIRRTDSSRKAMYELINVNDVRCRVGKEHDLTKCVYDHPLSDSVYLPLSWHCTICNINIDIDQERCMFCLSPRPEPSLVPAIPIQKTINSLLAAPIVILEVVIVVCVLFLLLS